MNKMLPLKFAQKFSIKYLFICCFDFPGDAVFVELISVKGQYLLS